jgi:hypothetical protein
LQLFASDKHLYQKLSENCLAAAKNYDRKKLAYKLLQILEDLEMEKF